MEHYTIRPACAADAKGMNDLRRMAGVAENMLTIPSERISYEEAFLDTLGPDHHQFAAVVSMPDGSEKLVGMAGLQVYVGRLRHNSTMSIMVSPEWHGKGVGQALLEAILDVADNWLMLVRIELIVFSDNERAIAFYEKMGFVKEGVRRLGGIRFGQYADEYWMARIK